MTAIAAINRPNKPISNFDLEIEASRIRPGDLPHPWLEYRLAKINRIESENIPPINQQILNYFLTRNSQIQEINQQYWSKRKELGINNSPFERVTSPELEALKQEKEDIESDLTEPDRFLQTLQGTEIQAFYGICDALFYGDVTDLVYGAMEKHGKPIDQQTLKDEISIWRSKEHQKIADLASFITDEDNQLPRHHYMPLEVLNGSALGETRVEGITSHSDIILPQLATMAQCILEKAKDQDPDNDWNPIEKELEIVTLAAIESLENKWILGLEMHEPTADLLYILHQYGTDETIEQLLDPQIGYLARKTASDAETINWALFGKYYGDSSSFLKNITLVQQLQTINRICADINWEKSASFLTDHLKSHFPVQRDVASLLLVDRYMDMKEGEAEVLLNKTGIFPCWGKSFKLQNAPDNAYKMSRLSFETIGVFDHNDRLLGITDVNPWTLHTPEDEYIPASFKPINPQMLSRKTLSEDAQPDPEDIKIFLTEFHEFFEPVGPFIKNSHLQVDPRTLPFELKFQIFQFLRQSPADQERFYQHMKRYRVSGAYPFLSMEMGQEMGNIVLELGEKAYNHHDSEIVIETHTLFDNFSSLNQFASQLGVDSNLEGVDEEIIKELILHRAKAILVTANEIVDDPDNPITIKDLNYVLKLYEKSLEEHFGEHSRTVISESAKSDLGKISDYYWAHEGEPNAMEICASVFESAWLQEIKQQKGTAYADKILEMTQDFYEHYHLIPAQERDKTLDNEADIARFTQFVKYADKEVPHSEALHVCMAGFGTGDRVEKHVITNIVQSNINAKWIAADLFTPPLEQLPDEIDEFVEFDLSKPPQELFGQIDALMVPGSIPCDLVLDEDYIKMLIGVNHLLKENGMAAFDDPFAYGEGSHEARANKYHQEHPHEPWGTFSFSFTKDDGVELEKLFRLRQPERIKQILETCGFEIVNPITSEIITELRSPQGTTDHLRNSDKYRQSRLDILQRGGVYKTDTDRMRQTIVIRKVKDIKESENILAQLLR